MTSQVAASSAGDEVPRAAIPRTVIVGGRVIDGITDQVHVVDMAISPVGIEAIGPDVERVPGDAVIDADGLLVAPALIDLHGDAFERSLMPRPRVFAPLPVALTDNRAQVAAAGIATSFLSATDSWEPGLRSRDTLRSLIQALVEPPPGPDMRIHVRRETTQTDGLEEMTSWLQTGAVSMLSFADHTPGAISAPGKAPTPTELDRSGCDRDAFAAMVDAAVSRRADGAVQDRALATLAHDVGCPTASHDGASIDDVERDAALGVQIAEFPRSLQVADAYRHAGMRILLGAPNLVRGGSHLGNLSVADVLRADEGDILCSDYHYPSLLQAPFAAVEAGLCSLPVAWRTVSSSPAAAAGLTDRGALEVGRRSDVVIIDDRADSARVRSLFVDGSCVYQAA